MAQLTSPSPRQYELLPRAQDYPMAASTTIYEGSAVSDQVVSSNETGNAEQLVAAENFLGFANNTVTNSGSAGAAVINLLVEGVVVIPVTGVTAASTGALVYAVDGNTFTLTPSGNSLIGRVAKIISGTTCRVHFQGIGYQAI